MGTCLGLIGTCLGLIGTGGTLREGKGGRGGVKERVTSPELDDGARGAPLRGSEAHARAPRRGVGEEGICRQKAAVRLSFACALVPPQATARPEGAKAHVITQLERNGMANCLFVVYASQTMSLPSCDALTSCRLSAAQCIAYIFIMCPFRVARTRSRTPSLMGSTLAACCVRVVSANAARADLSCDCSCVPSCISFSSCDMAAGLRLLPSPSAPPHRRWLAAGFL